MKYIIVMSTILFEWDRNGNFYLCQFVTVTPSNLDSIYIYRMANREIATMQLSLFRIALSKLFKSQRSSTNSKPLKIHCYYRKLTLFILDSSISSKLFFLEVQ